MQPMPMQGSSLDFSGVGAEKQHVRGNKKRMLCILFLLSLSCVEQPGILIVIKIPEMAVRGLGVAILRGKICAIECHIAFIGFLQVENMMLIRAGIRVLIPLFPSVAFF